MTDQTKGLLLTFLGVMCIVPEALFVRVIDAPIPGTCWETLRTALALRCDDARGARSRRKRRRAPTQSRR